MPTNRDDERKMGRPDPGNKPGQPGGPYQDPKKEGQFTKKEPHQTHGDDKGHGQGYRNPTKQDDR